MRDAAYGQSVPDIVEYEDCLHSLTYRYGQFVNRADGIGPLGAGGFEAGEIVTADEDLPCSVHRRGHRAVADSARRSGA